MRAREYWQNSQVTTVITGRGSSSGQLTTDNKTSCLLNLQFSQL